MAVAWAKYEGSKEKSQGAENRPSLPYCSGNLFSNREGQRFHLMEDYLNSLELYAAAVLFW